MEKRTNAQYVARYNDRMRSYNIRQLKVYVHDDDRARVKAYSDRLLAKRKKELGI